jgi:hypothetical protein
MYAAAMRPSQPFGPWSHNPGLQQQQPYSSQRLDVRSSLTPADLSLPALSDSVNAPLDFLRQRQQQYGAVQQATPPQYSAPPPPPPQQQQQQRGTPPSWNSGYATPTHQSQGVSRQMPQDGMRSQMPFDFQQSAPMVPYHINTAVSSAQQQSYHDPYASIIQQQGTYGQPASRSSWDPRSMDPTGQTPTPPPPQHSLDPMQQHLAAANLKASNAANYPATVGRQGTRGIIPSDPGVEPPSPDMDITPAQDPETGKFKCPNCPATFSFPKHVKRHFMRRRFLSIN